MKCHSCVAWTHAAMDRTGHQSHSCRKEIIKDMLNRIKRPRQASFYTPPTAVTQMIVSGAMVCCGVRICYDSVPPVLSCGSETLFACFAQLDLPAPFGFED